MAAPLLPQDRQVLKSAIYRPVWLPVAITATALLVALLLLMGTARLSLERLRPLHDHLTQITRLQDLALELQTLVDRHREEATPVGRAELAPLAARIEELNHSQELLGSQTRDHLRRGLAELSTAGPLPVTRITKLLQEIRSATVAETRIHDRLMRGVKEAAAIELDIAGATMVALPLLALGILFLVRRRVLLPLRGLSELMQHLARQDYSTASSDGIDPLLVPLFSNYNRLVVRLAELEREHRERREDLEDQVRRATATLLAQQRELDNAERLAAVGELAARIAHELRNPLAGIQMAMTNLRREITEPHQAERLRLVNEELTRIAGLLNNLLEGARHRPEPASEVRLARLVDELLGLARYQIPPHIALQQEVPEGIVCRLPPSGLRQSLLNLVLNAHQALAEQGEQAPGWISVHAERRDGELLLSVRDDGPGFDPEFLRAGLRPFLSSRDQGTGLGLTVVQRYVRALDGELTLENREPHGACVTLRLPCPDTEEA